MAGRTTANQRCYGIAHNDAVMKADVGSIFYHGAMHFTATTAAMAATKLCRRQR